MSVLRRVAGLVLMLAGGLACAYGTLILASIGSSDTATETLVAYGLIFVLPGMAAITGGTRVLRRH
jgi:drug/metabolite transporter (DMT)-like permease